MLKQNFETPLVIDGQRQGQGIRKTTFTLSGQAKKWKSRKRREKVVGENRAPRPGVSSRKAYGAMLPGPFVQVEQKNYWASPPGYLYLKPTPPMQDSSEEDLVPVGSALELRPGVQIVH
ncbi:Hypothetical_protein [Hexamita inflata]|uniref:Hypothetical_protein n=1 Tax=Hexamita inflata TaxID=28002 RepID=A0AA86R0E6_9EUKA|nr:Hypothetical protein HINF_LOCUS41878 [Hexamita inflata]CAI9963184.1 Hypothetical protein HINF_LOCUS50829 [Hexamita inflata]CAI9972865.1 Hypothetical protein HINF_LOCUS60510 [Hexamita inflata]